MYLRKPQIKSFFSGSPVWFAPDPDSGSGFCYVSVLRAPQGPSTADVSELNLDNVGGVFVVLLVGSVLASLVALAELALSVRRTAVKENVSNQRVHCKNNPSVLGKRDLRTEDGKKTELCFGGNFFQNEDIA